MRSRLWRIVKTAIVALLGWAVGWVGGSISYMLPMMEDYPFLAEGVPLPHHVPKYPGGISFRFAMANDVIHERFPKHGPAHYRERQRLTREALAKLAPDDPARFPLADDLGVGLERLGKPDEAVAVMREKLARQQEKGVSGRDLYSTYANLGTFLIHASAKQAAAGDRAARERFREGLGFVRKSVEVNPEAHFGREQWQAAIAEFLLAAIDNPSLLRTFDCLGNRLDLGIEQALDRERSWDSGYGRPNDLRFSKGDAKEEVPAFFRPNAPLEDPVHWAEFRPIRGHITKVGAEQGWEAVPVPSHRAPVAFDEPMLGIIGMWRQGGGANPHFALTVGETMLRVGQRYIAWDAFERAGRLADRYARDPEAQQFLRDHCRKRQGQIEETLLFWADRKERRYKQPWQYVSPPPTPQEVADLRRTFNTELALGEGFQRDYQEYEAAKLAAGVPISDPLFFKAFYAGREPIASPVGPEEWFVEVPQSKIYALGKRWAPVWGLFGAGVAVMGTALIGRVWSRWSAASRRKRHLDLDENLTGFTFRDLG